MPRFKHYGVVVTPDDFKGTDWISLCRKHGLRTLGIHSGGGASADVLQMLGYYGTRDFRDRVTAAGLECEYECHASASLLSPKLAAEHPEFFAYDQRFRRRRKDGNWCVSNPDAQKLFQQNAGELVRCLYTDSTHRYLLWNADCPRIYCHCDKCASLSPSDQAMLAVNQLAVAARAVDPKAMVPYLAYLEMMEPPARIAPEPNVFLEFAPIDRCALHAIDDPECAVNRSYYGKLRRLLEVFPAETAHVLEYYLDSSYFSCWRRPAVEVRPSREVMDRDFDVYAGLGIRSLTSFAVFMDGAYFRAYGEKGLADYAEMLNR